MNITLKNLFALLLACTFVLGLGACNTMQGLGKDTQVVGEKIEKEADRHIDDDEREPGDRSGTRGKPL